MSGLAFFALCFPSLFSIIDPFASVPVFLALVGRMSEAERRRTAARAIITALLVLVTFAMSGTVIFRFFGITVPAFKVAGGILLFSLALEMMRAKPTTDHPTPEETEEAQHKDDVAIIPIGIPLLAGPGAIATATMWAARAHSVGERISLFAAIFLIMGISFLTLSFAARVARFFGQTGINVITRIMGLILAATAAQFVLDGWRDAMSG